MITEYQQIDIDKLTTIFQKAMDGGYNYDSYAANDIAKEIVLGEYEDWSPLEWFIFYQDHAFAKAFFGPGIIETTAFLLSGISVEKKFIWQYFLQQLVVQDDYIEFLYSFCEQPQKEK